MTKLQVRSVVIFKVNGSFSMHLILILCHFDPNFKSCNYLFIPKSTQNPFILSYTEISSKFFPSTCRVQSSSLIFYPLLLYQIIEVCGNSSMSFIHPMSPNRFQFSNSISSRLIILSSNFPWFLIVMIQLLDFDLIMNDLIQLHIFQLISFRPMHYS